MAPACPLKLIPIGSDMRRMQAAGISMIKTTSKKSFLSGIFGKKKTVTAEHVETALAEVQ